MLKAFQSYITENKLISSNTTLIGVSGGRDSVVLCELYFQAKLPFAIAHCNFNLRGNESDEDEEFVKELAGKYQVVLHNKSCDTKGFSKENGISIQMAARELRFSWFEDLCIENGYNYYATAHHQDDAIETYLINQIRGTGIAGLHGIQTKLGKLIHPLLFASRTGIDRFIKEHDLSFNEDSSNSSTKYLRNKIRHHVLPLLSEINPQIQQVLLGNMQRIHSAEQILQLKVKECRKELCSIKGKQIYIQASGFFNHDFAPTLLYELIKEYGFNFSQANQALIFDEETSSGALFFSSSHRLLRDRDYFIIEKHKPIIEESFEISLKNQLIDFPIHLKTETTQNTKILRELNTAQLDLEKLQFPLILRRWQKGDFFYPLGMKGRKKLISDFFIDQKLSLFEKENAWILCSGNDIAWIINNRLDDRFKISEKTSNVFQISVIEE